MKKLLLFVLAAFAFAACEQAPIEELSCVRTDSPETITVEFEDDETRIQLNGAQKTVWTKNDQVSVFYRSNGNQKWEYTGETGARTAELKRVEAASGTRDMDRVVVVYPYNENCYINPSTFNVQASLPAVQHYLADSYGTDGNIMISSGEYNQFSLKSVCGWLKIQLTGDGEKIKSITLRGNSDEQVAGELYINSEDATAVLASEMGDADDNNAGGALVFDNTILREVVLDCGEGVELIPVVTSFYIALPPQSFEQGITLEITDDSGYTMTQSTSKLVSIERNHIQPMTAFEFINPSTPATPKPANNEIWYTATEQVEPYWDDANTYGVRLVSNTWDEATGKGVYTFAGDVTKVGAEAFLDCKKLKSVVLPDSATEIGSNAFKNCDGLVEVTIGDGVTSIGNYAFYDCDALTTISFGDGLQTIGYQAFYSCGALNEVVLSGNVITVESRAFYECKKLTSIVIGDSVTSVGESAFSYCSLLSNVAIGNGLTKINSKVFYNCSSLSNLTLGDGITEIDSYAFNYCSALQSIVLPDSVKTIKPYAFQSCSKLENITFGDNVETIDPDAFNNCNAIKAIYGKYATSDGRALIMDNKVVLYAKASGSDYTIPDGMTTIANRAFSYANLTSVTIPESVTSIEDEAFYYCSNLKKVYINALIPPTRDYSSFSNNASGRRFYVYDEAVSAYKKLWSSDASNIYGNGSYDGAETTTIYYTTTDGEIVNSEYLSIKENTYTDGQGKMVVCGKLDRLPEKAFYYCKNLTSVVIPDGITTIGNYAFQYCSNLTSVTIPDGVTIIGDNAFCNCNGLTSVTIPDGVTTIGDSAFYWCNLTSVTIPDGVTYIGCNAFSGCKLSSVTIPNSVIDIDFGAFSGCSNLTSFSGKFAVDGGNALVVDNRFIAFAPASLKVDYTIPENVTIIGDNAFRNCNGLTSVTIHDNVTSIGDGAFSDCYDLHSIVVGKGVENIGSGAFAYGSDQRSIYMKPTVPPTCDDEYAFEGWYEDEGDFLKIYVPIASEYVYKSSWTKWSGYIHAYDFDKVQTNYEIWYTSIDDILITPNTSYYGANVISNTYNNGFGVISFDREITTVEESMFSSCENLLSISLPESVTSIGNHAFSSCDHLTSITIPDSVEEIGDGVFLGCYNISGFKGKYAKENGKILVINGVLKAIIDKGINEYTIPNYITEIGAYVFYNSSLKSVTIPNSVTKIGNNAFYNCDGLTNLTIPSSVTSIGNSAFSQCGRLASVTISESVTTIGDSAFYHCDSLPSVTIPNSVTSIGSSAFEYCSSLTSITIPNSVTSIGRSAFCSCYNLKEFKGKFASEDGKCLIVNDVLNSFAFGCEITEYSIPSSVTIIGYCAFYNCDRLINITIPNSVTTIEDHAFWGCSNLTSINIPDSVTSIGRCTFASCESLTSVTIGDSIAEIGDAAFEYCSSLTSVYCKATTPPTARYYYMYWDPFDSNASGRKIYVPTKSVNSYKYASGWKDYASDIVGYDF